MLQKLFSAKGPVVGAILAGIVISAFGLWAQIDLCIERGDQWQGTYAAIDYDEPFYAAYVQSLIDGKPRRNSPYTGAEDSAEHPQKESYLSIQFLASYPAALIGTVLGRSSSNAMIAIVALVGFLSGLSIFWLMFVLTEDAGSAFVGTLVVLLGGGLAAGQGAVWSFISPDSVHYASPLLFLRRSVPVTSFAPLILFCILVAKLLRTSIDARRAWYCICAICCFGFTVYGYFYHWTTALAWLGALLIIWAIFRTKDLWTHRYYLAAVGGGMALVLVPYFLLLAGRSSDTDSALLLTVTRQPDLWRIPELISYVAIVLIVISPRVGWLRMREPRALLLMSFAAAAPIVFNQQVLTGRSLQPFHYQLFAANYLSLVSSAAIVLILAKRAMDRASFRGSLVFASVVVLLTGYFEASYGAQVNRPLNVWRDELVPVAKRIKEISTDSREPGVVMSFDLLNPFPVNSVELPAVSSQAILWGPHLAMFPDISPKANLDRLYRYLYYQDLDENWVRSSLKGGNSLLAIAFFGGVRSADKSINDAEALTDEQIERAVADYQQFRRAFDHESALTPRLSFVIVRRDRQADLSAIDRWYVRDAGENVGEYTLYGLKLREF